MKGESHPDNLLDCVTYNYYIIKDKVEGGAVSTKLEIIVGMHESDKMKLFNSITD